MSTPIAESGTVPSAVPPSGPHPGSMPAVGAPTSQPGSIPPISGNTSSRGTFVPPSSSSLSGTSANVDNPASIVAPYQLSARDYLSTFRLDRRFTSVPVNRTAPISHVMINFDRLYDVFNSLIFASLVNWSAIRRVIPGTALDITNEITLGAASLASAMILQLYNLLRIKFGTFDNANSAIYRNRCPLDKNTPLPTGCHFLVEQFGLTKPVDAYGNTRFLHHWDNSFPATFGLPPAKALNSFHLQTITETLTAIGVPFRRLNPYDAYRTPWDSLFITESEGPNGFNVETTYPESNYDLFKDAFIAIRINGVTTLASNVRAIQYYAPRASVRSTNAIRDDLKRTLPSGPDAFEAAQFHAAAAATDLDIDETLPAGHLKDIHPTGLKVTTGPAAADGTTPLIYEALIYGRGFHDATLRINSIVRGINQSEVDTFFNILIQKGI